MKILILSQFAGSRLHGMVLRNYNWARALTEKGHEVIVVAASYAHARSSQPAGRGEEFIDGIRYVWLPVQEYNAASYKGRLQAMAEFTWGLYNLEKYNITGADIIVVSSPHPFSIFPARKLCKKWKSRLIYDVRDMWPLTLKQLGNVSSYNPLIWLMQRAENYACRHCDLLTAVPKHARDYFVSHGLASEKFMYVPNGVLLSDAESSSLPGLHKDSLAKLRTEGKLLVGYAGSLGRANAMAAFVRAMAKVSHLGIKAVIVGQGPLEPELKELAKTSGIEKDIIFLPPVSHSAIPEFLDQIDVAYSGISAAEFLSMGASLTKLNDYMLGKKPILYSGDDNGNAVEASGGGICCQAENDEDIARALCTFSELSAEKLKEIGERGHAWLMDNQIVSVHMDRILTALK